jgi:hypothetical protein
MIFLDKGNTLISRDTNYIQHLQQRNTLMAVRMHTVLKKETKKIKHRLRYFGPSSNNTSTSKTTPELEVSKSDAFKQETVHKRHRRSIKYLRFSL